MQTLDAFAVSLAGYLLSLAVYAPMAKPVTPEQALDQYEQSLQQDLLSSPTVPRSDRVTPPLIDPLTPNRPAPNANYITPAKGTLTSGYGWRWGRMHKGIDIAAAVGTPIIASANGQVISSGWNSGGYGYLVEIRHVDGTVTKYGHNSKLLVSNGQAVTQGQAIALMGSTGYSTGSHCHFEIHLTGKGAVNPLSLISPPHTGALSSR